MKLTRPLFALFAALFVVAAAPKTQAQAKIAVVDFQRALQETADGRRAKTQIEKLRKDRQVALDAKQKGVQKMKEDIERQQKVLSKEALAKRLEEYQKAYMELQTAYVEYQRELAQEESKLTKQILDRMQAIVRQIGQSEGYTLIVEANEGGVIWAPGQHDLTDRLIERYNTGRARSSKSRRGSSKRKTKK